MDDNETGFEFSWTQRVQPDKVRFCVDCASLNKFIDLGPQTFKNISDINKRLAMENNKYFSQIDIRNAYRTIPMNHSTDDNIWCYFGKKRVAWTRLPFGLRDAPNHFNHVMNEAFADINNVIVYFDNILIATKSLEENEKTVCDPQHNQCS